MSDHHVPRRSFPHTIARTIRWLSVPIVLFWLAVAALTNVLVPQLEMVGKEHNVALSSPGRTVAEGVQTHRKSVPRVQLRQCGDDCAGRRQAARSRRAPAITTPDQALSPDTKHVEHIDDFWGDPLTAAGSQSTDGKAAYVQVFLAGNQGEALSLESVDAVRDIVDHTPAPPGVKAYVSGAAAQVADQFEVGNNGTAKVTLVRSWSSR